MNNKRPVLKLNLPTQNKDAKADTKQPAQNRVEEKHVNHPVGSSEPACTKGESQASDNNGGKLAEPVHKKVGKKILAPHKYKTIMAFLKETYPKCFTYPPVPLKLYIHKELLELHPEKFSKTDIRKFLIAYCNSKAYRQVHTAGASRIDLQGNVSSIITEEQVQNKYRKKIKSPAKPASDHQSSKPQTKKDA